MCTKSVLYGEIMVKNERKQQQRVDGEGAVEGGGSGAGPYQRLLRAW